MTGVTMNYKEKAPPYNKVPVICRTCGNTFTNQVSFYKHWLWPTDQLGRTCQSRAGMTLRGWTFKYLLGKEDEEPIKVWHAPRHEDLSSSAQPKEGRLCSCGGIKAGSQAH